FGLVDAAGDSLRPGARCDRLAALCHRSAVGALEQLKRGARAVKHGPRDADRAVVGATTAKPRTCACQRVLAIEQPEPAPERSLGLLTRPTPGFDLTELKPCVSVLRRDRDCLHEVLRRLVERCHRACIR